MRTGPGSRLRRAWTMAAAAAVLFALTGASPLAAADVYRWKDANGVTHYSDTRPDTQPAERIAVETAPDAIAAPPPAAARPMPATTMPVAQRQPDILMYDSPTCGWCRKAERYFIARNLTWRSIDVTASTQNRQLFLRDGGRGTPLIFIDGQRVSGFNQSRLDALLGSR
jgi:glutaredoxin